MIQKGHKPDFYGETKCKVYSLKLLGRPLNWRNSLHPKATFPTVERFTRLSIGFFILTVFIAGFVTKNRKNENVNFITPVSASQKAQPTFEDIRRKQVKKYLNKHNPKVEHLANDFVTLSISYAVDPALTIAVARQESSLCRNFLYRNCFGIGGASNLWSFETISHGIEAFAKLVGTSPYYKDFRESYDYYDLARVYCPPRECNTKAWAKNVERWVKEIESI